MRFSVIIPIFNGAKTLAETLLSLQNQTFTQWEVIAIDDGSDDDSVAVFRSMTKDWPTVKLLQQTNCGLGQARNKAAENAQGEWLVFLDADDLWAPNKLAEVDVLIQNQAAAEVVYHAIFELSKGGFLRVRNFVPIRNTQEFIGFGNPLVPSAMAIKKSVFFAHGKFIEDREQVEDLLFWFRLLAANVQFVPLKKPLTKYRIGAGITSNLIDHMQKVQHAVLQACAENLISETQKHQFLQRKNYEAARQLHKLGDFKNAHLYYENLEYSGIKLFLLTALNRLKISI